MFVLIDTSRRTASLHHQILFLLRVPALTKFTASADRGTLITLSYGRSHTVERIFWIEFSSLLATMYGLETSALFREGSSMKYGHRLFQAGADEHWVKLGFTIRLVCSVIEASCKAQR